MKIPMPSVIVALALGLSIAVLTAHASAQESGPVQSLRGVIELDELNEAPPVAALKAGRRFDKAYRQQPPLIPHKTDKYQINTKVNQCLRCHDWPYNVQEGAPKISETHYADRNGVALDKVTRSRWFCTQCHVNQTDAPVLVGNDFVNAVNAR
ncbi:MAG: nitrate reductase cytochrome c-type subunit; periplasmic nitrate reductase electron transfer subunit [Rhodospirillaceae bacterium]|jgi:nitrate reductase (cytochrome), electron transfer subunit|nr:nitrate reductase cytochrome c-type subunit; periplasmic nitrate reductase electron transfer subunit [Rhodospirillaceae bacterium]MBT3925464.1 nitrate reductase cytochrome c-type subunit; periplasmic nitrate reductase electron transfer subunit [Rhodospirillaceae bacterium]MBT5038036.1 nitrate reductase cytochrome c-type subunit; periplasmic nitrate reductase electron transfer subunit [Rhodospirillaceae bacterium]MBT5779146.1 nitrate reductase cytochrome c-type subunit; periplasmic nitrate red